MKLSKLQVNLLLQLIELFIEMLQKGYHDFMCFQSHSSEFQNKKIQFSQLFGSNNGEKLRQ